MGLEHTDFTLTDEQLARINEYVRSKREGMLWQERIALIAFMLRLLGFPALGVRLRPTSTAILRAWKLSVRYLTRVEIFFSDSLSSELH